MLYTYDLTRGWLHQVTLETIQPDPDDTPLPICLAGERHCPPEFCAGVWGYTDLLDRLSDGDDPEFDTLWQQVGDDFDPEYFELASINRRLAELRKSSPSREG
ncbi:MAG: plasmid pRiA4b ORF-3 family protein [Leptolyngbyaceae cyanobacterium SM2_3_12]|nr:plasmid pRiA4b ORF-3 family protein [Leptolyngbyaceae cyanobacterium SM2_3_12]